MGCGTSQPVAARRVEPKPQAPVSNSAHLTAPAPARPPTEESVPGAEAAADQQEPPKPEVHLLKSEVHLRIFHINDVYKLDNFPAFKACVDDMGKGCPNVLKGLAGDFLAPSVLSTLDHGKGVVRVMNECGFDAVCFGNHESDVPNDELIDRINELEATWLNSNMRSFTQELSEDNAYGKKLTEGKCPDMRLLELQGGRKIVLIGLNCHYPKLYRSSDDPKKASFLRPCAEDRTSCRGNPGRHQPRASGVPGSRLHRTTHAPESGARHRDCKADAQRAAAGTARRP